MFHLIDSVYYVAHNDFAFLASNSFCFIWNHFSIVMYNITLLALCDVAIENIHLCRLVGLWYLNLIL